MKHLKPRDILQFLLFALSFVALFAVIGYLETAPLAVVLWVSAGLAVLLWSAYIYIIARQRAREHLERMQHALDPTAWIAKGGLWVAADGSGRTMPMGGPSRPVFDYDA